MTQNGPSDDVATANTASNPSSSLPSADSTGLESPMTPLDTQLPPYQPPEPTVSQLIPILREIFGILGHHDRLFKEIGGLFKDVTNIHEQLLRIMANQETQIDKLIKHIDGQVKTNIDAHKAKLNELVEVSNTQWKRLDAVIGHIDGEIKGQLEHQADVINKNGNVLRGLLYAVCLKKTAEEGEESTTAAAAGGKKGVDAGGIIGEA